MSGPSITDILNRIESRLDTLDLVDTTFVPASLDPLSEVGLYITRDALLRSLYHQYLQAQQSYISTLKAHGKDNAMSDIAGDIAEGAYCSMETRLIELRKDEDIAKHVKKIQKKQHEKYQQELLDRQIADARRGMPHEDLEQYLAKADPRPVAQEKSSFWIIAAWAIIETSMNPKNGYRAALAFSKAAA